MHSKIDRKAIGNHLQQLRKAAGYRSAKAFAAKAGVNPNTYTQYEQGLVGISFERAWQFADILECTLDELGGRVPPSRTAPQDADESALIEKYRSSTPQRREFIIEAAEYAAAVSKDVPECGQAASA